MRSHAKASPAGSTSNRTRIALLTSVALLTLVVGAAVAIASKKVDSFVGSPTGESGETACLFSSPSGVAVNEDGTGGTQAGDYYVADASNNRIQQFNANGTFVRAFGQDVVAEGPDQANEVQWVTVNATEGEFNLSFGPDTSADLPFDATASEVEGALNALGSINAGGGSVSVTGGPGDGTGSSPYVVRFDGGPLQGTDVEGLISANGATPLGGGSGFGADEAVVSTANSGATGYEVCEDPASLCKEGTSFEEFGGVLSFPQGVAVDQSSGDLYVTDFSNRIQRFSATGEWVSAFGWDTIANGAATGDEGEVATFQICTTMQNCKAGISGSEAGQVDFGIPATGPSGSVYLADRESQRIQKFDSSGAFISAWGWDVVPAGKPGDTGEELEACPAAAADTPGDCQMGTQGSGAGQFGSNSPQGIAVDSTEKVYALDGGNKRILSFDSSGGSPASFVLTDPEMPAPTHLAVGPADHVFVVAPCPSLEPQAKCPGASAGGERWIKEYDPAGALQDNHMVGAGFTEVSGLAANTANGNLYASVAEEEGANRVWTLDDDGAPAPLIAIDPVTDVTEHTATFTGAITPNGPTGISLSYRFEYSRDGADWTRLPATDVDLGDGSSPIEVSQSATGLEANVLYRVRIVTTKDFGAGVAVSPEVQFTTTSVGPEVQTFYPIRLTAETATLRGQVNPNNLATTYHFEYGETSAYGSKAPVPDGSLSGGTEKQIYAEIGGLKPDTTYHVRLVATNAKGTSEGDDVEFRTRSAVREEGARAYEMLTPPLKAVRSVGGFNSGPHNNANPGVPSLDGESVGWGNTIFPLVDDIKAPAQADIRLMQRTPQGWTFEPRNTRQLKVKFPGVAGDLPPAATHSAATASSADLQTATWHVSVGNAAAELLPSEGEKYGNRWYIRRDGTGVDGYTPWLRNVETRSYAFGIGPAQLSDAAFNDYAHVNDSGSAVIRWGWYRGLTDDPSTAAAEDPSATQQLFGETGGRTPYTQRAASPTEMPSAPKDLVNGCTGSLGGGDATLLPVRVGTGVASDTIGTQPCAEHTGTAATGTATRTTGSNTLTGVNTESGAFAVGQIVGGEGIAGASVITAVGAGTLTLSQNPICGGAGGEGRAETGSTTVTKVAVSCGEFEAGQSIRLEVCGFGCETHNTTITAVDGEAGTLSLATPPTGFFFGFGLPVKLTVASGEATINAESQSVTSIGGASIGDVVSTTAMSNDGNRFFFTSPDSKDAPSSACTTATGPASSCVKQLFVRQYDSNGDATVRWISRAQGVGSQEVAELGRGASFEGASEDGRYVYFKTNAPLLPTDPNGGDSITAGSASDSSFDLYRYELPEDLDEDPAEGTLTRISGGPTGTADPGTNHSTAADVSGRAPPGSGGALRYHSEDGKLAYFLTTSPIAAADATPPQGAATAPGGAVGNGTASGGIRNLYLFDDTGSSPQWRFITQLPWFPLSAPQQGAKSLDYCASFGQQPEFSFLMSGRSGLSTEGRQNQSCFRGTPDARQVVFMTTGRLTADDTDEAADVYLYDYERDELTRVTAPPPGAEPYRCNLLGPGADFGGICNGDLGSNLGGSGFGQNTGTGRLAHARGWSGGRYYNLARDASGAVSVFFASQSNLVPEDTDTLARFDVYQWREGELTLLTPDFPEESFWYSGNSLDGEDLFFQTGARIDPREIDNADLDIYDLRIGGGFPYTPPPIPCDVLNFGCEAEAISAPPARSAPTATFSGEGNAKQGKRKPRRCAKRKVRRQGRCVAKKSRKKKSQGRAKRASSGQGRGK